MKFSFVLLFIPFEIRVFDVDSSRLRYKGKSLNLAFLTSADDVIQVRVMVHRAYKQPTIKTTVATAEWSDQYRSTRPGLLEKIFEYFNKHRFM